MQSAEPSYASMPFFFLDSFLTNSNILGLRGLQTRTEIGSLVGRKTSTLFPKDVSHGAVNWKECNCSAELALWRNKRKKNSKLCAGPSC